MRSDVYISVVFLDFNDIGTCNYLSTAACTEFIVVQDSIHAQRHHQAKILKEVYHVK